MNIVNLIVISTRPLFLSKQSPQNLTAKIIVIGSERFFRLTVTMPGQRSKLLAALDSSGLGDDELDIIRYEIEDDPDADMDDQEDPETPTLSREGPQVAEDDNDNRSETGSITQTEDSPPPPIIPTKRKRVSRKQRERDAGESWATKHPLWSCLIATS